MSASSSTIYKLGDDSIFEDDVEAVDDSGNYSEVLITIQNNLVDIHTLGCYILLALAILIGVGVIRCWKK